MFATGAAVGSFLNVVICRLPEGKSLIYPPSHCPACGGRLSWRDLVPVMSYFLLRGRCRRCGAAISAQYPLVELACGALFLAAVCVHGLSWEALRALLAVGISVPATVIDLRHRIIPDRLNLAGLLLALPLAAWPPGRMNDCLWGFLAGGGTLLAIALLSRGGIGGGDVKLAAVLGLILGLRLTAAALFLSFVAGSVAGLALVAARKAGMKDAIPFGPFLGAGAVAASLFGERLWSWYGGFWVWVVL